jgi:hypothetical protein
VEDIEWEGIDRERYKDRLFNDREDDLEIPRGEQDMKYSQKRFAATYKENLQVRVPTLIGKR